MTHLFVVCYLLRCVEFLIKKKLKEMALAAEQTFGYEGKDWPPAGGSGDGFVIEGSVSKHYPLKIRKAKEMQGYLKSTVAADVAEKRTGLVLTVTAIKNAKTKTTLTFSQFFSAASAFLTNASASTKPNAHLFPSGDDGKTVVIWCAGTVVGDLRTRKTGINHDDPLGAGTLVRITTSGDSLIAAELEVTQPVINKVAKFSMEGKTNLLSAAAGGGSGAGYQAKLAATNTASSATGASAAPTSAAAAKNKVICHSACEFARFAKCSLVRVVCICTGYGRRLDRLNELKTLFLCLIISPCFIISACVLIFLFSVCFLLFFACRRNFVFVLS